jgi:hypothetical protein
VLIDLPDCYFFPFPNRRPDLRRPHGGDSGERVGVNLGQAYLQPRDLRSVHWVGSQIECSAKKKKRDITKP